MFGARFRARLARASVDDSKIKMNSHNHTAHSAQTTTYVLYSNYSVFLCAACLTCLSRVCHRDETLTANNNNAFNMRIVHRAKKIFQRCQVFYRFAFKKPMTTPFACTQNFRARSFHNLVSSQTLQQRPSLSNAISTALQRWDGSLSRPSPAPTGWCR